jgi:F5/8 type C domain
MAGDYILAVNGTLIVPTRRPDLNATVVEGNLAQCKPVISSNTTTFPGQFPVAAVDSSNGTAWQPSLPDASFIIVDLEQQQTLSGVHINWGEIPARSFEVKVGNDSETFTSAVSVDVEISAPYDATLAASVEIIMGNVTNAQFNAVGRYILSYFIWLTIGMSNLL